MKRATACLLLLIVLCAGCANPGGERDAVVRSSGGEGYSLFGDLSSDLEGIAPGTPFERALSGSTYSKAFGSVADSLLTYKDRDLWACKRVERAEIVGGMYQLLGARLDPCLITEMASSMSPSNLVCVEAARSYAIPSEAMVRMTIVDRKWVNLAIDEFSVGYRVGVRHVNCIRSKKRDEQPDTVVVEVFPYTTESTGTRRLFFAIKERSRTDGAWPMGMSLVRVEDGQGNCGFPLYWATQKHLCIGPEPDVPSLEDPESWVRAFQEGDIVDVLTMLFYLCSDHSDNTLQLVAIATTIPEALRRSGTLDKLRRHSSPWVREYAESLSQRPQRDGGKD